MIPMMIDQGFGAIAVAMDTWGLAHLVYGGMAQGRVFAQQAGEAKEKAEVNGKTEVNGKVEANDTSELHVTANGKASP
jgi:4-hydroxy-2-oxoheptanedioate aldolase